MAEPVPKTLDRLVFDLADLQSAPAVAETAGAGDPAASELQHESFTGQEDKWCDWVSAAGWHCHSMARASISLSDAAPVQSVSTA